MKSEKEIEEAIRIILIFSRHGSPEPQHTYEELCLANADILKWVLDKPNNWEKGLGGGSLK